MDTNKDENTDAKPAYTRLTALQVLRIVDRAMDAKHSFDFALSVDILDTFQIEEYEAAPGTFFVEYRAKSWRDATAFQAAVVGMAWALGCFADVNAEWRDALVDPDDGGRRFVSVFIAAADYVDETGHVVA